MADQADLGNTSSHTLPGPHCNVLEMQCGSLHVCYVHQLCMRLAGFANDQDASGHQSDAAVRQ